MEEIIIISIVLAFSVAVLFLSFYKKQFVINIMTGILYIILGSMFIDGVQYKSGYTSSVISENVTNYVYNYSVEKTIFTLGLSTFFYLFGVLLIIISALMIFSKEPPTTIEEVDD